MKMTKSPILTITALLLLMCALPGFIHAQEQSDLALVHPEVAEFAPIIITESDYSCLQNLDCIKDTHFLSLRRWNISFTNENVRNASNYMLKGQADNEEIRAIYDADGSLIEAEHIRKNTRLPLTILNQISQPDFSGWKMTSNQVTVKDFNPENTTYIVQMEKSQHNQEIHFNHDGEIIYRKAPIDLRQNEYSCFQSIECLKNNPEFKKQGWQIDFKTDDRSPVRKYQLESYSNNVSVQASYDYRGRLKEATLIRSDSKLPHHILSNLVTDHNGWTMISNKTTVKDFDQHKVTYEVTLQKNGETKQVKYDANGNLI
jgi:hypothetical protein